VTPSTQAVQGEEGLRAEVRLLATMLVAFSAIKVIASSLSYVSALVAAGGTDTDSSRTLFWMPQVLFYTLLLASSRRLRRFEPRARVTVLSLSVLSLAATLLYAVLNFAIGPGRNDPALEIAIKLRLLLVGGDIWDFVFPLLAILWLRTPQCRRLFAGE
jgi:hypothetical protein